MGSTWAVGREGNQFSTSIKLASIFLHGIGDGKLEQLFVQKRASISDRA
jgi:hypothetical protein